MKQLGIAVRDLEAAVAVFRRELRSFKLVAFASLPAFLAFLATAAALA